MEVPHVAKKIRLMAVKSTPNCHNLTQKFTPNCHNWTQGIGLTDSLPAKYQSILSCARYLFLYMFSFFPVFLFLFYFSRYFAILLYISNILLYVFFLSTGVPRKWLISRIGGVPYGTVLRTQITSLDIRIFRFCFSIQKSHTKTLYMYNMHTGSGMG